MLSILWTIFDVSSSVMFAASFLELRWNRKRSCAAIAAACAFIVLSYAIPSEIVYRICAITLSMGLIVIIFRGTWQKQLLSGLLSIVMIGIIDTGCGYGVSALLGITFDELVWKKMLYTIVATSAKLSELLLAYLFCKFWRRRKSGPIRSSWLLLTVLFPAVSLVMLLVIYIGFRDRSDVSTGALIFTLALAAANVAILYLIHVMEKRTREEEQLHLMNQQMEIQTGSILALERSYRAQRAATHEFQNQLDVLGDLLEKKQYQEAEDYLKQLQTSQSARVLSVNTHHPIMDAILNQKYQQAKESGIDIQLQVNDLSGVRMETDAMVVLFSNLLDNAIEACQRLPDNRAIRCSILATDELYVSIRNTSAPVTITNGRIPTTKSSKAEHGFGLISIRRILDGRNAEYSFQYQDGWFQFAAEIPLCHNE